MRRSTRLATVALSCAVLAPLAGAQEPPADDTRPLPTQGGRVSFSRIEPLYSRVATTLARKPVEVRCWNSVDWTALGPGEASGYVNKADRSRIHFAPVICDRLGRLAYLRSWPRAADERLALASAVTGLGHELQHAAGISDEPTAECRGQQVTRRLARMLGVSPVRANKLALLSWRGRYPKLPPSYKTPSCRNGGALDMRPADQRWP